MAEQTFHSSYYLIGKTRGFQRAKESLKDNNNECAAFFMDSESLSLSSRTEKNVKYFTTKLAVHDFSL